MQSTRDHSSSSRTVSQVYSAKRADLFVQRLFRCRPVWSSAAEIVILLACHKIVLLPIAESFEGAPALFLLVYSTESLRKFCPKALEQLGSMVVAFVEG